jgi:crossover junction endodeoxyribonuclease RuvC
LAGFSSVTDRVRILGIDPGSRMTGYGLVDAVGGRLAVVACGVIETSGDHSDRLHEIFCGVGGLVTRWLPNEIAIERVFVHRNADSALKLGQARAAALCATFTAEIPIHEYAARQIKKAVVGRGSADKAQVQHMVRLLLGLDAAPQADAADALAAAICHANSRGTQALLLAQATQS